MLKKDGRKKIVSIFCNEAISFYKTKTIVYA